MRIAFGSGHPCRSFATSILRASFIYCYWYYLLMSVAYVEHVAGATVLSTNEHEPPLNHQHLPNHHHQRSLKESLFSVIAPSSNSTCFEKVGGEDPLACWLRNLKVLIPDESFQKGLFSLTIKNLVCSNLNITGLSSSYEPSSRITTNNNKNNHNHNHNHNNKPSLTVSLSGLSLSCVGNYKSGFSGGTVSVLVEGTKTTNKKSNHNDDFRLVTEISSVEYRIHQHQHQPQPQPRDKDHHSVPSYVTPQTATASDEPNPPPSSPFTSSSTVLLPTTANVTNCTLNVHVPPIHGISFSGSVSARILELFSKTIANHVTDAIREMACPQLTLVVDEVLTKGLGTLGGVVEGLLDNYTLGRGGLGYGEEDDDGSGVDVGWEGYEEETMMDQDISRSSSKNNNGGSSNDGNETITWDNDLAPIKTALVQTNTFLQNHLDRGIVLELLHRNNWLPHANDDDCGDCGYFFRGINGLVRYLTNGTGALWLNLTQPSPWNGTNPDAIPSNVFRFVLPKLGIVTLTLQYLNVTGLDTFTNITLGLPTDNLMLSTSIGSKEGFGVSTGFSIVVDPIEGGFVQGGSLEEEAVLEWSVTDVGVGGSVALGYLKSVFNEIEMGDLVAAFLGGSGGNGETIQHRWGCLLSGLVSVVLSDVELDLHLNSVGIYNANDVDDDNDGEGRDVDKNRLEKDVDRLIDDSVRLFLTEYDDLVTRMIFAIGRGPGTEFVNKFLKRIVDRHSAVPEGGDDSACGSNDYGEDDDEDNLYRFNESSFLLKLDEFVDGAIPAANAFASCVASYLQGSGGGVARGLEVPRWRFWDGAEVVLRGFGIENFGRFDAVDILKPQGRYHIDTGFESGACPQTNGSSCPKLKSNMTIELVVPDAELSSTVDLTCALGKISSNAGTSILYDRMEFYRLKVKEILDWPWMLARPLEGGNFYGLQGAVDSIDLGLKLSYVKGESGGEMSYWSENPNELGDTFTTGLMTAMMLVQDGMNGLVRMVFGLVKSEDVDDTGKVSSNSIIGNSNHVIESSDGPDVAFVCWMVAIAFILAHGMVFLARKQIPHRWVCDNTEFVALNHPIKNPPSLMFHRYLSNTQRMFVPIVASATILLFIVSNLSTGASVDVAFTLTNSTESLTIPRVFTFSLGETVSEMYQAKVYTLMMLVLVFSGIWPYVKMLLLLLSFVVPRHYLGLQRRERLLVWLDALGKYSLVDSFVLVLMLVSFRFHIDVPGFGSIDSYVIPEFGFYSFMGATIMSLTFGHGVTYLHRQSMLPRRSADSSAGGKESIASHIFDVRVSDCVKCTKLTLNFHLLWLGMTLTTVCLVAVGVGAECFVFDFRGLAGLALGEDSVTKHSLISLGMSIPSSVKNPFAFGVRCIRWTYLFFALVMPFTCIGVVTILYFVPMKLQTQRTVFSLAEICNAWSAIEVFLISVYVSLLELSQFSSFMVGHHCDFLKGFLGQDTCFDVQSSLGPGSTGLCLGVLLHCGVVFGTLRLCHRVLDERMTREGCTEAEEEQNEKADSWCDDGLSFLSRSWLGQYFVEECSSDEYECGDDTEVEGLLDTPVHSNMVLA